MQTHTTTGTTQSPGASNDSDNPCTITRNAIAAWLKSLDDAPRALAGGSARRSPTADPRSTCLDNLPDHPELGPSQSTDPGVLTSPRASGRAA